MYWERQVRFTNKKKNFLQPIMILIIFYCNLQKIYTVSVMPSEQQTIGHYRVAAGTVNHFHSIY